MTSLKYNKNQARLSVYDASDEQKQTQQQNEL